MMIDMHSLTHEVLTDLYNHAVSSMDERELELLQHRTRRDAAFEQYEIAVRRYNSAKAAADEYLTELERRDALLQ